MKRVLLALITVGALSLPAGAYANCEDGTLESLIQQMNSYADEFYGTSNPVTDNQKMMRQKLHILAEKARLDRPSDGMGACWSILEMTQKLRHQHGAGSDL